MGMIAETTGRGTRVEFDYRCDDAHRDLAERAAALDGWLDERLGGPWRSLRSRLAPTGEAQPHPRRSWGEFLCGFELARIESRDGADAARSIASAWSDDPPTCLPVPERGIGVLAAHPSLQRALDSSWRPDIHRVALVALGREALGGGPAARLASALAALSESSPTGWRLVEQECAAVAIVTTDPPLADQGAVSLTVKRVPGLVIVSEVPVLLLIEGLVHEAAHLWLNGVERVREFCADPDLRLVSPLRRDPRPVSGLLHQAWVLAHLAILHDELAASGHRSLADEMPRIEAFRRSHRSDLTAALDTLEGTPGALTEMGRRFTESMRPVAAEGTGPRHVSGGSA